MPQFDSLAAITLACIGDFSALLLMLAIIYAELICSRAAARSHFALVRYLTQHDQDAT